MTKIKICGLKRECDIDFVNEAKPDYIGFVFADTKRYISPHDAMNLKKRLDKNIKAVGVFVNADILFVSELVNEKIIDVVQLHGDEDDEYIKKLKSQTDAPIIKAVRVKTADDIISADRGFADFLLLDKYSHGIYGGTGESFDWSMIPKILKPYFIAGGITAENVSLALRYNPYAVDVSSGVETGGLKDKEKILNLVKKVRSV